MKTILILHGRWWSSQSRQKTRLELEQKGYHVIVPDLPGFWETILKKVFTIHDYASWIKNNINLPEHYSIIAHSNGGRIALHGIDNKIFNPEKLILVNSAGIDLENDPSRKRKLKRKFVKVMSLVANHISKNMPALPVILSQI